MARQVLKLSTLTGLDLGKVDAAFQIELQKCIKDLMDRPGDEAKRSVVLQLDMIPEHAVSGVCETAQVEFTVAAKVPVKRSRVFSMKVNASGGGALLFNPESPDDASQGTLDEVDKATGEVKGKKPKGE